MARQPPCWERHRQGESPVWMSGRLRAVATTPCRMRASWSRSFFMSTLYVSILSCISASSLQEVQVVARRSIGKLLMDIPALPRSLGVPPLRIFCRCRSACYGVDGMHMGRGCASSPFEEGLVVVVGESSSQTQKNKCKALDLV